MNLHRHAPQGASDDPMIALPGRGNTPRPIFVRNHDRPMRHRKIPTASKMFLFIQFEAVSDACLNANKFVRPKRARNSILRSTNNRSIKRTTQPDSSQMSLQTRTLLLIVRRIPRKAASTIHSSLWRRNRIRCGNRCGTGLACVSRRRKRSARCAKTLTTLEESPPPRRRCAQNGRRRDFFAQGAANPPETAKLELRSLV